MKRSIISIVTVMSVLFAVMTLAGCDLLSPKEDDPKSTETPETPEGPALYEKDLWGEWIRMDTGDRWYITDAAITINGERTAVRATLSKQSERVIAVKDGGRDYYLYAARTATASFTGVIVGNAAAGSARAIGGGLGGVKVAIANLANKANEVNATTDAEGAFTATGVIPGDSYLVTPESGKPVTVTPSGDGEDIGVVTVTSGVNFKTSIAPAQSSTDMNELYINEWYDFNLTFENVGTEDCYAPNYAIAAPGVSVYGDWRGVLGTIEPDVKKSVPISVRCSAVGGDWEYKTIQVTISDATGKTWEDAVSLRFYRESLTFTIKAERSISGIVITPDAKTYSFTDVTDGAVTAPRRTTGDYLVVFSGATIETETPYSLGVDVAADGSFSGFINTSRYEPNNAEGAAVSITAPRIMAYLHKNDIDYYRVSYGALGFLAAPANVSASVADAQVTVSWDAVAGAVSYNVYRATSQTGTYAEIGASASPSYVDAVSVAGTYYYKVSAVSADGVEGARSAPAAATVAGLPAPANISASAADAQVTVSWGAVAGAVSYNVYRAATLAPTYDTTYDKIGASASPSYVDAVSVAGTYYYKVGAVSADGVEGSASIPASVTITTTVIDADGLAAALTWLSASAVEGGDYSFTLTKNETLPPRSLSYSGKNVSLTLNGGDAERTVGLSTIIGSLFTVESGVTLTLGNNVTLQGLIGNTRVLVGVNEGGTLAMENGSRISGNTSVGVHVGGGAFTMSGGEISGNSTNYNGGGVIVSYSGTFTMSGGTVSGNAGGGVYVSDGTFTMSGGEVSGNTANYSAGAYGGGVYVSGEHGNSGPGTFTMTSGAISGNTVNNSAGGGVYVDSFGTFTMTGGEISGNTANYSAGAYGGGVYVRDAVHVYGGASFAKSGGTIYGADASDSLKNTSTNGDYGYGHGHAVYVSDNRKRDSTAGESDNLNSAASGAAGGWE